MTFCDGGGITVTVEAGSQSWFRELKGIFQHLREKKTGGDERIRIRRSSA